ncbi:TetR family transcriptional regulator [Niabella ginsenosidivorans]|uniref:TetR family transcriptional regulator n=1 Tax=Niabella ginsenosidivorans TaxID=1176587 RepID=A0A1A9I551_9BACT|nr:TetR/AcrR family transcriptional regulator [Niabella ginsenosidivorans]ANH82179.1 TetR family transcriptional regulator [Niabella ginsenosidivorans]
MARKVYKGAVNNKERSIQKLLASVGKVIREKGYAGLTATNIAQQAGVSRRLISMYFGSVDELVETYVKSKDYWVAASGTTVITQENKEGNNTRQLLESLLLNQLDFFNRNEEMRQIILWEISQRTEIMYHICNEREQLGSRIFEMTDKELKDRPVDLRAVSALLVAGIYYMVLHSKTSDSFFCEIDITLPEGLQRIRDAIKQILKWVYEKEA